MPVTAGALLTSVSINGSVGLGCLLLFGVLRKWKLTEKLYEPKRYTGADTDSSQAPAPLCTPLPQGLLSWTRAVWVYPEADVIQQCGMDVAVFFRLLHLGVKLFFFLTIWCCVVVMPVNFTGGYLQQHKRHKPNSFATTTSTTNISSVGPWNFAEPPHPQTPESFESVNPGVWGVRSLNTGALGLRLGNFTDAIHTNLDLLTLSNVAPGSPRMWIHLASVYLITLGALKLLWDLSRDVAFKRAEFLATQACASPAASSVLVTDVPGLTWGTPLNRLQLSWLKWLLPAGVFRRGFDAHQQQQQQQRQQVQKTARRLLEPLLPSQLRRSQQQQQQQEEGKLQDVWHEAVDALQHNGGDVKALVHDEMCRVYGSGSVQSVVPVYNTAALDTAAAKYWQMTGQFEDVLDWYQTNLPHEQQQQQELSPAAGPVQDVESGQPEDAPGSSSSKQEQRQQLLPQKHQGKKLKRRTVLVVGSRHGAWGVERYGHTPTKVDALEFYTELLPQQLRELQHLQQEALRQLTRPAAFVTFKRQLTATLASSSLHCYDEAAWSIGPAPQPQEVEWGALGVRTWELVLRQVALWAVFWLLVVFYAPIVAAVQAPVNMDNLRKVPILATLVDLPLVSSLLQGFLPSLVLLAFLAVAPYLLKALIQRAGLASMTAIDAQLIGMYFLFQLFAVFIFSFISGTALSQLQGLIDDPHRIVSLLGVSAPQQASFFSTWTLLLGLSRTPLQLLRLPQLVWYLLRLPLADTPRQQRRLWSEQQALLGYTLPLHTLVLLLGLVFCVASPLIAPVTLLYFVSVSVAQRYQWIYIYRHPYEGAGTLWRQVFTQVLVGIYFFVGVMGCLLGVKQFEYALLLLPLGLGVLVFHVLASRALQRPLTLPSAREAAAVDHDRGADQQQQQQDTTQGPTAHPSGPSAPPVDATNTTTTITASSSSSSSSKAPPKSSSSKGQQPEPALEKTGLDPEVGEGGEGATPQVTRRTAGDVSRAFGQDPPEGSHEVYLAPSLQLAQQHLQPLLDEAADVQRRLAALGW